MDYGCHSEHHSENLKFKECENSHFSNYQNNIKI